MDEQASAEAAEAPRKRARGPRTLDRRTVLGAAILGGAGMATGRLLAGTRTPERIRVPVTGTLANAEGLDWVSPLGDDSAKVAHLLRRTTFGYTQAELEQAQSDGYARTVERLVESPPAEPKPLANADKASQLPGQQLRLEELRAWWLDWMLASPTPFAERMTLFWHGHFTSDFRKVGLQSPFVYWQNQTWRRFALGDLRTMLYEVTVDPAMLRYLDLAQSTARNPNENYARELMELYTMGAGTFGEDDVKSASKALSGWREPRTESMIEAAKQEAMQRGRTIPPQLASAKPDAVRTGVFARERSHTGGLPFLGVTRQWDTQAVIDRILEMDVTAPFVARKVAVQFVSPSPDEEYVAALAAGFRRTKYSVKELMRTVLLSPEFTSQAAYRSLIKSPIELMLSTAKALGNSALARLATQFGEQMGQTLFDPPSVGGWPNNESWISSNAMLARANFVTTAVTQTRRLPPAERVHATQLDSVLSPQTLRLLNEARDERARWIVALAGPEFQLK
ncbi:MAG TPA: DUF1800 domain-containing protein [Candidatus Limnocylindria bacterium]|nr:DUF1800 domain-containing protein [Candidatus Limnocylindria bacterium]